MITGLILLKAILTTALLLPPPPAAPTADAIEPGNIEVKPTWGCIGINWHFQGDDNQNASVSLTFRRKGTSRWRPGMDLWRHSFEKNLMFSGSLFRLAPNTEYEIRLTMKDPDTPEITSTVNTSTLVYPRMPVEAVLVGPGGLARAQELARPGTVCLLSKGEYSAHELTKSGEPNRPIVYRAAGDGEVVIKGEWRIIADHIWLDGLTVTSNETGLWYKGEGLCVTNCVIKAHYAIWTREGAANCFISDNRLFGDAKGKFSFSGEGVDFGSDQGACGHAVSFNELTDFADGISYGSGNVDVYNNYIHETVDDFVEPDYAHENYRVWNNRLYNSMCGFSFQPMRGGPWYFFNNINVGTYLHPLKIKSVTGPSVINGNTFLTKKSSVGKGGDMLKGLFTNNLWLRTEPGPLAEEGRFNPGPSPTVVDYNAYGNGQAPVFDDIDYSRLTAEREWDRNSLRVDYRNLFVDPVRVPMGRPAYRPGQQGWLIPNDWKFDHNLLIPRDGAPIIDAGLALPNITGPYLGKAPDIGAHEFGLGTAWYGPRTWDHASGLVYGLPDGWRNVDPSDAPGSLVVEEIPKGATVLLSKSKRILTVMTVHRSAGERRWNLARAIVNPKEGDLTKVLEFQDGFYARLGITGGKAVLRASRVEAEGVLEVNVTVEETDLPLHRVVMFQFVRSLYR